MFEDKQGQVMTNITREMCLSLSHQAGQTLTHRSLTPMHSMIIILGISGANFPLIFSFKGVGYSDLFHINCGVFTSSVGRFFLGMSVHRLHGSNLTT